MKSTKVHKRMQPTEIGVPICTSVPFGQQFKLTNNDAAVTCKRCLHIINRAVVTEYANGVLVEFQ